MLNRFRWRLLTAFGCLYASSLMASTLKVGLSDLDYPPFYFQIEGEYRGAAMEIAQHVAADAGFQLKIVRSSWKHIQDYLKRGSVDMMILYLKTPERAQYVYYTETPHIYENSHFVVQLNQNITYDQIDLNKPSSYRFGHVAGYSHGTVYNQAQHLHKFPVANEQALVKTLISGRIDIAVGSKPSIIMWAKQMGLLNRIQVLEPPIYSGENFFAFSKAAPNAYQRMEQFSQSVKRFIKTDAYRKILKNYNIDPLPENCQCSQ